jgi:hypothetical protein
MAAPLNLQHDQHGTLYVHEADLVDVIECSGFFIKETYNRPSKVAKLVRQGNQLFLVLRLIEVDTNRAESVAYRLEETGRDYIGHRIA